MWRIGGDGLALTGRVAGQWDPGAWGLVAAVLEEL